MRNPLIPLAVLVAFANCGDDKSQSGIDAAAGTPSCTDYCTKVMANCTGDNAQYGKVEDCTNSCKHFMMGTLGMTTMNTVGCRIYHAEAAQADPATHCQHAGPGGGGQCGKVCGGYCKIAVAACPDVVKEDTCMADCDKYPPAGTKYSSAIQSGNTAECRLYHATAAATDPGAHCGHVGDASTTCK